MELIFIPIVIAAVLGSIVLVAAIYQMYYTKVPPDEVAIFTGRKGYRIVHGGASIRWPVIERVDRMSLAPFEVGIQLRKAYSKEGVPVDVDAVALVRFESDDASIRTAVERFLNTDRNTLKAAIHEILSGHLRSIVAKMTVEELNANREKLVEGVSREAGVDFKGIGMGLDVLTVQQVKDELGYLDALGRTRTAEVKRDAQIGEAEASRDSQIKSAEAMRAGEMVQASAEADIAEAQRDRDVRMATYNAQVEAENARAEQSGPQATQEALRAVVKAEVEVEESREKANIAVEEQSVQRQRRKYEADVIVPANAQREAVILEADGSKLSTIALAEGEAEARKQQAEAHQIELEAEGAGIQAKLTGEGVGQTELAAGLNAHKEAAFRLKILPDLINKMPEIFGEIAKPMAKIDSVVLIDSGNGNNGASPIGKWGSTLPLIFAQGIETLKAVGLDIPRMLSGKADEPKGGADKPKREEVSVAAETEAKKQEAEGR